jgi:hypothetical protein
MSFAAPPGVPRQEIKAPVVKIPHEIVNILEEDIGKVEADLTTKEIIVTNIQREGSLILKLFRDYARVPGQNVIYRDPVRFPLWGDLYVVAISSERGFAMATFQFVTGKLHIVRQD